MNPLDMPGPQFLLFYLALLVTILILVKKEMRKREIPVEAKLDLTDPYEIAILRKGAFEAMRVAAVSLVDRGLMNVSWNNLSANADKSADHARRPIERAMLKCFSKTSPAIGMFTDPAVLEECRKYEASLSERHLLAGSTEFGLRKPLFQIGLALLVGTACLKIGLALARGYTNVTLLIMMCLGSCAILSFIYRKRTTQAGERAIADLKFLFKGLEDRAHLLRKGGDTNEVALLAAIFGVTALSAGEFSFVKQIFPNATTSTSSCGSNNCGSSSGGDAGGGCGGGGCGGCGGGD